MIAAYIRVSSSQQNLRSQRVAIERYAEKHSFTVERWYEDKSSGTVTYNRKGLKQLRQDITGGKVKRLILFKLDRLSRRMVDAIQLLDDWHARGCEIVILDWFGGQTLDMSSAMGRATVFIFSGLAEFMVADMREKQAAGISAVRAKNGGRCYWGGGHPGHRKVDPVEVFKMRHDMQMKFTFIARAMGISARTAQRYYAEVAKKRGIRKKT